MILRHVDQIHMCLSIKGALRNTPKNNKASWADGDNGRPLTNNQFRAHLMVAEMEGKRVLPMGDCDNFCFQNGCRGHGAYTLLHDWEFEEGNG